ncbi:hypothetical protein ES705_24340 [subsurface metagenome]
MKKKLLIGLASVIGIFILIGIIAIVTAPEEQLTSAEQAYATTIATQATTVGNAFPELGKLQQNPQYGNEDWTLKMATQLAIIRTTYNEAMEMQPPDSMTHIHYKYVQGMKHYHTMTELLAEAIDQLNADLLEEATAEMNAGTQLINETTELMTEFNETHK